MIDGWNITQKKNESVSRFNELLSKNKILIEAETHTNQGCIKRFTYEGWIILYLEKIDKYIITIDFNFSRWDFYEDLKTSPFMYRESLNVIEKSFESFRLLKHNEVFSIAHKFFPNTISHVVLTDDNFDTADRKRCLFIADTL